MIYDEPRYRIAGDRFIEVELGNELTFDLNVIVHNLAAAVEQAGIAGLIELIPELASFQVSYDPDRIGYDDIVREIEGVRHSLTGSGASERESRLFHVPLFYFDPWTAECVEEYRAKVRDKVLDPDYLCEINGLADRRELMRVHSGTEYWVAALGFWPGLCSLMPLDPRSRLIAPKYNPPRMWTPKGTIGLGGGLTSIYPDRTPGGYQIFARTPMPIWDREGRLPAFKDSLALFRAGDRVRFVPIDREEYDHVERKVADGTYQHPCVEYQTFSVARYRQWRDSILEDGR
ncbi:5-oxoprolinase subunit B family protein [Mesorhizobium ventifaucium]|uniref:Transporter n=1 Tax=Mesorhizobium ventifaucium TaxID=666020 RepID=A0ABM9DKC6_9HYPH|nr:carboxyltransferase domain-containing protein [Mesorhizobium ventifaucium]CAH2396521.1 Transporter [Mesorhizobium ventifaucium]